jgi:hypothetical protein
MPPAADKALAPEAPRVCGRAVSHWVLSSSPADSSDGSLDGGSIDAVEAPDGAADAIAGLVEAMDANNGTWLGRVDEALAGAPEGTVAVVEKAPEVSVASNRTVGRPDDGSLAVASVSVVGDDADGDPDGCSVSNGVPDGAVDNSDGAPDDVSRLSGLRVLTHKNCRM